MNRISLNTFPKGIYFVKINDLTKKMIVDNLFQGIFLER
jgi:hypothetical protein